MVFQDVENQPPKIEAPKEKEGAPISFEAELAMINAAADVAEKDFETRAEELQKQNPSSENLIPRVEERMGVDSGTLGGEKQNEALKMFSTELNEEVKALDSSTATREAGLQMMNQAVENLTAELKNNPDFKGISSNILESAARKFVDGHLHEIQVSVNEKNIDGRKIYVASAKFEAATNVLEDSLRIVAKRIG